MNLAFLLGCIPLRLFFVYIAYYYYSRQWFNKVALLAILPILGWIVIYSFDLRKSGPEAAVIWWNNLRLPHALWYTAFLCCAFMKPEVSWIPLLGDVSMGLGAHIIHNRT